MPISAEAYSSGEEKMYSEKVEKMVEALRPENLSLTKAQVEEALAKHGYVLLPVYRFHPEKGEVLQEGIYHPYPKDDVHERHLDSDRNWWGHFDLSEGSITAYWQSKVEGDQVTFTLAFGDSNRSPLAPPFSHWLAEAAGTTSVTKTLETPVVNMPAPGWVQAGEYYLQRDVLPLAEAKAAAVKFVQELLEMGLLGDSTSDYPKLVEESLLRIPTGAAFDGYKPAELKLLEGIANGSLLVVSVK